MLFYSTAGHPTLSPQRKEPACMSLNFKLLLPSKSQKQITLSQPGIVFSIILPYCHSNSGRHTFLITTIGFYCISLCLLHNNQGSSSADRNMSRIWLYFSSIILAMVTMSDTLITPSRLASPGSTLSLQRSKVSVTVGEFS